MEVGFCLFSTRMAVSAKIAPLYNFVSIFCPIIDTALSKKKEYGRNFVSLQIV